MPRRTKKPKEVEALTHGEASRKNIPTAEYQSMLEADDRNPIEVAYRRANRDLDPQLVWRGKDVLDWSDLVVPAPLAGRTRSGDAAGLARSAMSDGCLAPPRVSAAGYRAPLQHSPRA